MQHVDLMFQIVTNFKYEFSVHQHWWEENGVNTTSTTIMRRQGGYMGDSLGSNLGDFARTTHTRPMALS